MRRKNPVSSWWIFGIVAGAGAVIAGVAYAASSTEATPSAPTPTGTPPQATLPTTPAPTVPTKIPFPTFTLDSTANGTTVQAKVGDTISIAQSILSNGTPWSYSYSGPAVTQGKETTSKGAMITTQTDIFNAAGTGTSVISAHDGAGGTFSVTVVVT